MEQPPRKHWIQTAKGNIERFHQAQQYQEVDIETQAGVRCQALTRPIEKVDLYIPGGSPSPIANEILYAAQLRGVQTLYAVSGAQAIFAMANGTAIDMPVNPSEVLVIADKFADPEFVVSDLLSQTEQGADTPAAPTTFCQPTATPAPHSSLGLVDFSDRARTHPTRLPKLC